jgi:thiol-disulfide isomerase/thioredoxin
MKKKHLLVGLGAAALFIGGARYVSAQQKPQQIVGLRALSGDSVQLESFRGRPVVLSIGASWLPLSRDQIKITNALQQAYGGRGVSVYFVYTDNGDAKSKNYATDAQLTGFGERNKIGVQTLRDPQSSTLKAFNLDQIPAFVVLDKQGAVAASFGGIDPESDLTVQISAAIDKIL